MTIKTTPVLRQIIDPPQTLGTGVDSIEVLGTRLIATEGGFVFVFNISNPESPQTVGYYDIPGTGYGIAMTGDLIFVGGGNAGVSILRLKDVDKPTVAITSPTANTTYGTTAISLSLGGTASDDIGVTRVSWANDRGGGGAAIGTTNWQITEIQLAAGLNVITVTSEDANGNLAEDIINVNAILPDATAPVVTITTPKPDDVFVVETNTITLSGSAADNQSVTSLSWSNDFGALGSVALTGQHWSITNLLLVAGPNVFHVTATDAAGNSAGDTAVIFFIRPDTNAPSISIEFPTLNALYGTELGLINLSGTAVDNTAVRRVEWFSNHGEHGTATDVAPWSINDVVLRPGLNVINVVAYDEADNSAVDSLAVIYTPPPPQFSALSVTNGAFIIQLSGTVGAAYAIQTSSNLVHWTSLSTNTIPLGGSTIIADPAMSNHPTRFYRVAPAN